MRRLAKTILCHLLQLRLGFKHLGSRGKIVVYLYVVAFSCSSGINGTVFIPCSTATRKAMAWSDVPRILLYDNPSSHILLCDWLNQRRLIMRVQCHAAWAQSSINLFRQLRAHAIPEPGYRFWPRGSVLGMERRGSQDRAVPGSRLSLSGNVMAVLRTGM